jgi:hypothetical protein
MLNRKTVFVFDWIETTASFVRITEHRIRKKGREHSGLSFRKEVKGFSYKVDLKGTAKLFSKGCSKTCLVFCLKLLTEKGTHMDTD